MRGWRKFEAIVALGRLQVLFRTGDSVMRKKLKLVTSDSGLASCINHHAYLIGLIYAESAGKRKKRRKNSWLKSGKRCSDYYYLYVCIA